MSGSDGDCDIGTSFTDLDVEEAGPRNVGHWRADLLAGVDDVDPKGVHGIPTDVVAVNSRDQHLALVVVDEQAANHLVRYLMVSPSRCNIYIYMQI